MKIKKILALALTVAMLLCAFIMPTNAAEIEIDENTAIIIENENISEETKAKIIAYYTNEEHNNDSTTYGLTCTLFGHKLDSTVVAKITHKARTTSPRCLEKTYTYETCTRCDYEESILISSIYIVCC